MTRPLLRAAVLLALLAAALVPFRTEPVAGDVRRSAEFIERVNRAIDEGATWLREQQEPDGGFGTYGGYPAAQTALAYHTLRVCGVPRDDPAMESAYRALHREYVAARDRDELRTYTAALIMMAIESRWWPERRRTGGASRYADPETDRTEPLDERDLGWMRELVAFVEGNQNSGGAWTYGQRVDRYAKRPRVPDHVFDHSNTQYALLGLKSASRTGVDVDHRVYEKALEHLLAAQERDGPPVLRVQFVGEKETFSKAEDRARGWHYRSLASDATSDRIRLPGSALTAAYGSMTAGSLGALVICRSELLGWNGYSRKLDAEAEQSIWDGIAWLGRSFSVTRNPNMGGWHFYYLYALERAGVLAGVDWMGEHDWYGDGADYLTACQDRGGSWSEAGPRIVSTCFALLFLKKGTKPVAQGAVTPSGGAESIDFDAAVGLEGKDLEDFVDLVVARWRRASGAAQRDTLRRGLARVGRSVVLPLLKRMATGDEDERRAAHSLVVDVTGQTFAYDAAAGTAARYDQLMAWEEWYMARADRLRYDERSGRLVTR